MATGEVVFERQQVSSSENDMWDDTELIKAYDNAVTSVYAKLDGGQKIEADTKDYNAQDYSKRGNRKQRRQKRGKKNKENKEQQPAINGESTKEKFQHDWVVGAACQAVYSEDGYLYDAIIKSVDHTRGTCVVFFKGYGNEQETKLNSLFPSYEEFAEAADKPVKRKNSYSSYGFCSPVLPSQPRHHHMHAPKFPGMPHPPNKYQKLKLPPMVPPPLDFSESGDDQQQDALNDMLLSWYMSGYHTGYYEGLKAGQKALMPPPMSKKVPTRSPRSSSSSGTTTSPSS